MVSTFTENKDIEQPDNNDYVNNWDGPVNANWAKIDKAFGGRTTINVTGESGNRTLTKSEYGALKIVFEGAPTAAVKLVVPADVGGLWVAKNSTTGGFQMSIASAAAGVGVPILTTRQTLITCDGNAGGTGMTLADTSVGVAGGLDKQVQFNNSGVLDGSVNMTWDSPTLTITGLAVTGDTALGNAIGDATTVSGPLTAGGKITSTNGGFGFPGGSTQLVAATTTVAAGSNRQVQYNTDGAFDAEPGFIYDAPTNTLSVPTLVLTTPLAVSGGGTGVTTSTGTGDTVRANSPTLNGTPDAPTAALGTSTTQIATTRFVDDTVTAARVIATTDSLSVNVDLGTNPAVFITGPSTAVPADAARVYASGTVTLHDSTSPAAQYLVRLWDGTTVIAEAEAWGQPNQSVAVALSGTLANPAGNLRISVRQLSANPGTNGFIRFNAGGGTKTSTVTALRIQ